MALVKYKLLKCHLKAKHRAPVYSLMLCQVRGVVQRGSQKGWSKSGCQRVSWAG